MMMNPIFINHPHPFRNAFRATFELRLSLLSLRLGSSAQLGPSLLSSRSYKGSTNHLKLYTFTNRSKFLYPGTAILRE